MSRLVRSSIKALASIAERRGLSVEAAMGSVVERDGDSILVDLDHPSFPHFSGYSSPPESPRCRPGTELAHLLKRMGFKKKEQCQCSFHQMQMDDWGCDKTLEKIDEVVGWLEEEAKAAGLPFLRLAAKTLVRLAVRNARRKQGQ